ncbi:hypothetical protein FH972_010240 [Carpinus fangiana]|nr:hypothetical protein FH972_010240 [Carpinus fangiana]
MAAKQQPANRVYEDIDPQTEWAREQDHDTLILVLPGFRREQLKVQVTSTRILRVSGERCVDNNKWRRFEKEFPIAANIDTNSITAKYEGGMLYIKHPKVMTLTRSRDQAKPTVGAPRPQPRPTQKSDQQPPAESPRFQQMDQPRPTQKSAQQPPAAAPRPQQQVTQKSSAQEQAAQQVSSKSPNADEQTEGKTTAQAQANAQKTSPKKEKEGNEISEAKKDSRKTPVELPSEHANKKQSTWSPDSDNVSQKTGAKETAGSSEKFGKVAGPSEKQKTHGYAEMKDKRPMTENDEQEGYTQWVYSLATELKKPKKLMNLIVAALLVVVFVLYAKHAAKIKELESKLP